MRVPSTLMVSKTREPRKWTNYVSTHSTTGELIVIRFKLMEDWRTLYWALVWTTIGILVSISSVAVTFVFLSTLCTRPTPPAKSC